MKPGLRTVLAVAFLCLTPVAAIAAPELIERNVTVFKVEGMFGIQRFAELEKLSTQYRDSQSRSPSGLWYLTLFYGGFDEAFSPKHKEPEFWEKAERSVQSWIDQYPDSPTAQLAYAKMLLNHAYAVRDMGGRNARYDDLKPYLTYLHQAWVYLEVHKKSASVDPYWYELMVHVAYAEDWSEPEFKKLLDEGLDRHPRFYQLYFAAMDYYASKWNGNAASLETFARDAVKRTKAEEGTSMYARIYWYASQAQFGDSLFFNSVVDWPAMKKSMDEVLAKYPDAWNLNNYARFACLSQDKLKTAELLNRIGDDPLWEAWGEPPQSLFEPCKEWAFGKQGSL